MIFHPAESRGHADHGWLKSYHTFSFANYYDPDRMNFGALRVINDDLVMGGMGFAKHPHKDMEIISIPLLGDLEHADNVGNHGIIRKGEVQIMSAGTGIMHSEKNGNAKDPVGLLQIWVLPKKLGVTPRYDQRPYELKDDATTLVVSPDGRDGSVSINQDAFFSLSKISSDRTVNYNVNLAGNGVYVFVIEGQVEVNGKALNPRDGLGLSDLKTVTVTAKQKAEVLIMEVPM
jgi:quercetin 2,3-dioxygenase